jgi:hypothetical protein
MDKNDIVKFLTNKRRGIYSVIVAQYVDEISGIGVNLALELIEEDLEKSTGQKISLNYFSLAQAISKIRKSEKSISPTAQSKNIKAKSSKKYAFKDAHESSPDIEMKAGSFKIKD